MTRRASGARSRWWLAVAIWASLAGGGQAVAAIRYCQPMLIGAERTAATEVEARKLALESWVQSARQLGAEFTGWRIANNKTLSCRKSPAARSGGGDGQALVFTCQARAAPCTISQVPLESAPPPSVPNPATKSLKI